MMLVVAVALLDDLMDLLPLPCGSTETLCDQLMTEGDPVNVNDLTTGV